MGVEAVNLFGKNTRNRYTGFMQLQEFRTPPKKSVQFLPFGFGSTQGAAQWHGPRAERSRSL